jgi:hypothetical protein
MMPEIIKPSDVRYTSSRHVGRVNFVKDKLPARSVSNQRGYNSVNQIVQEFLEVKIPGVKAKHLRALYEAKCRDLVINPTKD